MRFLLRLAAMFIIHSHQPGKKSIYLHWVDYHKRYWTLDYDYITKQAKKAGICPSVLFEEWFFIRAFSRDNVEAEKNWDMIHEFGHGADIVVLDSASELFAKGSRKLNSRSMAYAIGNFSRLCKRENCFGIVLENSGSPIHQYLGEISSIIMEFGQGNYFLRKHPCMPAASFDLDEDFQPTLARWLS